MIFFMERSISDAVNGKIGPQRRSWIQDVNVNIALKKIQRRNGRESRTKGRFLK